MDREDGDALLRRMQEEAAKSGQSQDSSEEDDTQAVREGTTRAIDADDLSTMRRERDLTQEQPDARTRADSGGLNPDRPLGEPPDMPESVDVTDVAPDGTNIGRTLNSPTREAIGGSDLSDSFEAALGGRGSRGVGSLLDPLTGSTGPDSDLGGFGIDSRRGISLTDDERKPGTDAHFNLVNEQRGAKDQPPLSRDEYDRQHGIGGSGGADGAGSSGSGDWRPEGISAAAWQAADDFETENLIGYVKEHGAAAVFPANEEGKSAAEQLQEQLQNSYINPSGGDGTEGDEEKPDPTAGDDVITAESIAAAIKLNDPGVYAQTTEDSGTVEGNATNLADNDPQIITNYGPDGPQTVEVGADWAPPVDTLFDPPPEGGSAGMAGAHSAMADPGAALSGSVIGSSTPEAPPDPPPTPPGDDPGGDPWGPPPDEGDSHGP